MFDFTLWKVVHLIGALALYIALGGLVALRAAGAEGQRAFKALHGWSLAVMLVAGFGMLGQLGFGSPGSWGAWIWIKLAVFLLLGASLVAIRRLPQRSGLLLLVLVLLGGLASWAALAKP
jgi:hypothetical protein